ncbi:hypothetical protein [Pseudomonas mandelii]|uniref:hypothetical protein n=1 Tax=Pseudomonas mandelii TaxID=75612 RepID=UPI003D0886B7
MTSFKPLDPAQNRARYLVVRQSMPTEDAAPPYLHADNPLLPDTADDLPNQLHSSLQGAQLKVLIPRFAQAGDENAIPGFLNLTWNGSRVGTRYDYTTPIDPAITEFELLLPAGLTNASGSYELSYILSHGGNPDEVAHEVINIDTQAPLPNGEVTLPAEVERDGITKPYLDANGFVLVTVPQYATKKIGDEIEAFFGISLPGAISIGKVTVTDTAVPVTFNLTAAQVGTEEGEKELWYTLMDRKGNKSLPSAYKKTNVSLTDPPEGLLPPNIPLFDDDTLPKLVDLADARMPLGIGILAEYDNYIADRDEIEVTVDGILLPAQRINGFPFYVNVPYSALAKDSLGEKTITTSYQIKRGTVRHPLTPLTKNIVVDLRRPGPGEGEENPNPDLDLVTVQGQGGNGPNVLTEDDKDQTVSVTAQVFDGVKDGDVATLIWKGVEVTAAQGGVIELDGTETDDLEWTVEWEVVDEGGNGNPLPVSYKLTNPDLNENEEFSLPQDVDVYIRPGVAPEVRFQHMDPDLTLLNCQSLRADAVLGKCAEALVAGGEPELKGKTLACTYQGYSDSAGTTVKPGTKYEFNYSPSDQEVDDGFIIKVRYQELLATQSAWGEISYVVKIDGRDVTSSHFVRVHMVGGTGTPCPI